MEQDHSPEARSSLSGQASEARGRYEAQMQQLRAAFEAEMEHPGAGARAARTRSKAVDALIGTSWSALTGAVAALHQGLALVAVGGYGRGELFPYSDVDLMFLVDGRGPDREVKEGIRRLNQQLWDAGLRVSPMTRTLAECGRFDAENVEFTLALLDARLVAGDAEAARKLTESVLPKMLSKERRKVTARLLEVTRARHAKYGDTLFHLEPNVKECPGGLRDVHVCAWLTRLQEVPAEEVVSPEFLEAREFLLLVRAFLHFRHGRDDNTLDWQTQDEAAAAPLGISQRGLDASYWMRLYFRHARAVLRRTLQASDAATPAKKPLRTSMGSPFARRTGAAPASDARTAGMVDVRQGRVVLAMPEEASEDRPEHHPETVFRVYELVARNGVEPARETEMRIEDALPYLSANLEDGPVLWDQLRLVLTAPFAGKALRAMHAVGLLELVMPEFHGIDALVIRDAYHRYTVDEHTFVLIDTLHALLMPGAKPEAGARGEADPWSERFAGLLRDLPHPELLFLAALLHDTGKGHATGGHAGESARLARSVVERLELDAYEAALVIDLIRDHLEMSAALRRDVFDAETIRSFAARVPTPEALRMLTLFTYADIAAVHPDALTPWKAENLWRLYLATSNYQDRSVDDERVPLASDHELGDVLFRVHAMLRDRRIELAHFLEGLPLRYLQTRTPDHIRTHFEMASRLKAGAETLDQIDFRYQAELSEVTLVTLDRPMLFANMAGALAAWGMNIVTADAFSNTHGVVVDTFRFTDPFRTLELNDSERNRFAESLRDVVGGRVDLEKLLAGRRRGRRKAPKVKVETRVDFDDSASTQSTLLQVIAQDTPGLLRSLAFAIAEAGCNIEVALVDTEGEMAIDVFYITRHAAKLEAEVKASLRQALLGAMEENAR